MPVLYFMMIHLVLKVTSDDVREALLVAPLAVPSLRVKDLSGSGSTHGSSLQFWHFPIYGEDAYVLEGRHGGLVGTRALGEENGPNKYVPSHKFQVCLSPPNVSSKN